mgnify:CR=1 FL=1
MELKGSFMETRLSRKAKSKENADSMELQGSSMETRLC